MSMGKVEKGQSLGTWNDRLERPYCEAVQAYLYLQNARSAIINGYFDV